MDSQMEDRIQSAQHSILIQKNAEAIKDADRRVTERFDKLEANQRWAALTVITLLAKAMFDIISGGGFG